jgi:DNA-binding NtrC family response regulator
MTEAQPDVLIVDLRMPEVDGMTILTVAQAEAPSIPVVMMTAYATIASAVNAIREGAFDYITKPFTAEQLLIAVDRAVRYRELTLENQALREQVSRAAGFEAMIGSSAAFLNVLDQVRKVAPTNANVLICGESGTGKELIARSIHANSRRKEQPFVPIDCAAMPEGLLESELFGHERGAFTGAVARKHGLLQEAHGGTVFLDEFTELSMGLQSKLLRALEERKIRRLGGSTLIDIDIRVVAATNTALEAAVAAGTFREDLYYRLNVVRLDLPALREREGDIALLAQSFLGQFSAALDRSAPRVSPDVWDVLQTYPWPGNIRELRNLVERLIVLDDDGRVTLADLPEVIRTPEGSLPEALARSYEGARVEAQRAFKAAYLKHLLEANEGNISKAARVAGVSRRTLHRWLAELGQSTTGGSS